MILLALLKHLLGNILFFLGFLSKHLSKVSFMRTVTTPPASPPTRTMLARPFRFARGTFCHCVSVLKINVFIININNNNADNIIIIFCL